MDSDEDTNTAWESQCIEYNERDQRDVAGFAVANVMVVTYSLSCTGLSMYWLWQFYCAYKDNVPTIVNRKPLLTMATVLVSVPITAVFLPIVIDLYTLECYFKVPVLRSKREQDKTKESELSRFMEGFVLVGVLMTFFLYVFLIITRVWVLRFEYNWKKTMSTYQWKELLGLIPKKPGWWDQHSDTYGNQWWVLPRLLGLVYLPMCALFVVLTPTMKYMNGDWTAMQVVVTLISVTTVVFIVLNVYKFRAIHDSLAIRDEIVLLFKLSVVFGVVETIVFAVGRGGGREVFGWTTFMFSTVAQLLFMGISYIQTRWVINFNQQRDKTAEMVNNDADALSGEYHETIKHLTLAKVLSTKDGFELFMSFLVGEFSTENLLCYIECTQFVRKWKIELLRHIRRQLAVREGLSIEEYCDRHKVGMVRPPITIRMQSESVQLLSTSAAAQLVESAVTKGINRTRTMLSGRGESNHPPGYPAGSVASDGHLSPAEQHGRKGSWMSADPSQKRTMSGRGTSALSVASTSDASAAGGGRSNSLPAMSLQPAHSGSVIIKEDQDNDERARTVSDLSDAEKPAKKKGLEAAMLNTGMSLELAKLTDEEEDGTSHLAIQQAASSSGSGIVDVPQSPDAEDSHHMAVPVDEARLVSKESGNVSKTNVLSAAALVDLGFEDEYSDDEESNLLLEWPKHHSMLERFPFMPYAPVVSKDDITMYIHFMFLESRYIREQSDLQVNIRGRTYREWSKLTKNKDVFLISSFDTTDVFRRVDQDAGLISSDLVTEDRQPSTGVLNRTATSSNADLRNLKTKMRATEGVGLVLQIVQDTREELWRLMQDSFGRFRGTPEFFQFCMNYQSQHGAVAADQV